MRRSRLGYETVDVFATWDLSCLSWTLQPRETLVAFVTWGRSCLCDEILVIPAMSDLVTFTMWNLWLIQLCETFSRLQLQET